MKGRDQIMQALREPHGHEIATRREPGRAAAAIATGALADDDALHLPGRICSFARGSEIYAEGSAMDHLYRVVSGAVRICKVMADGRRQIVEFSVAGDTFGLDGLATHGFSAEAITATTLVCYPRRQLEEAVRQGGQVARLVERMTLNRLVAAQNCIVMLGRKTAQERVASFLLEMCQRTTLANAGVLMLPMSRYDIADHLGLTVETVSRVLGALRREGAIALADAHNLRVLDRGRLRALSEDRV